MILVLSLFVLNFCFNKYLNKKFIFQNDFLLVFFYHTVALRFFENLLLLFFLETLVFPEAAFSPVFYPYNNNNKKIQQNL